MFPSDEVNPWISTLFNFFKLSAFLQTSKPPNNATMALFNIY